MKSNLRSRSDLRGFFNATSESIMFIKDLRKQVTEAATWVSGQGGWWLWRNNTNGRIFPLEQQWLSKRLIQTWREKFSAFFFVSPVVDREKKGNDLLSCN